jgi:methanogenic corrinoid protein MtbC1
MEALEAEDRYACINYVTDALLKGRVNIADLYENILKPALNNIECKVGDKKVCIWKEHVRSSIVRSVIECCYPYVIKERDLCNVPKRNQYVVVLCPDGEYHELGARMVSDFFTICGFDSIFIGSSTPKEELFNILDSINPIYIALSITNYYNLVSAKKTISEIRKKAHKELKIIVGGNAFLRNPDAYREIGADALVNTFKDIKALKITDFKP